MKARTLVVFAISAVVCTLAASHRFYDSAHTIGTIKVDGGKARHPILLERGRDSYTIIATATVLPPYRGDVRVAVEGEPAMEYEIYPDKPVINLNPYHRPEFRDNTLHNLKPRDKVALWVVMKPAERSPDASGMAGAATKEGEDCCAPEEAAAQPRTEAGWRDNGQGSPQHRQGKNPGDASADGADRGSPWRGRSGGAKQFLAFYDASTNQPVLKVPIVYKGKGEKSDGSH